MFDPHLTQSQLKIVIDSFLKANRGFCFSLTQLPPLLKKSSLRIDLNLFENTEQLLQYCSHYWDKKTIITIEFSKNNLKDIRNFIKRVEERSHYFIIFTYQDLYEKISLAGIRQIEFFTMTDLVNKKIEQTPESLEDILSPYFLPQKKKPDEKKLIEKIIAHTQSLHIKLYNHGEMIKSELLEISKFIIFCEKILSILSCRQPSYLQGRLFKWLYKDFFLKG